MEFRAENPGAVQFGNFINYYQFNSADERIKLLPSDVWLTEDSPNAPYLVLDVGCNAGNLTQLLWRHVVESSKRDVYVLGIDIDPILIERCQESNDNQDYISFACADVMKSSDWPELANFLKRFNRQTFDAICCFSITMWIHLNHHDEGLRDFLSKLSAKADLFVVEPQPWKCYKTAEQRMKKARVVFPLLYELKWNKNVEAHIEDYMENVLKRRKVHESNPTKWKRKICFYR